MTDNLYSFRRPDPVLCTKYAICKQAFTPGTILLTLQDEQETMSFCPDCWVYYQRKITPGIVFTPSVSEYISKVRARRINEEPLRGQLNSFDAQLLKEHMHKNIAAGQQGTGPAVMAMMPPHAGSSASGPTGYSLNHSQYQALTAQARGKAFPSMASGPSKPSLLSLPSLRKVIVTVSLKYRKTGVIALKLVDSVVESYHGVASWTIQTLRNGAYMAIHPKYLKFARGHTEWLLLADQLRFRQKSGIRIDEEHSMGETIQSVFDLGTGPTKAVPRIEVYFEMETSAYNSLQTLISDESIEEEYGMYQGGTESRDTNSPMLTDS